MLKAIGFTDADLGRPIVGIANSWIETMPCNFNLARASAPLLRPASALHHLTRAGEPGRQPAFTAAPAS